MTKIPTDMNVLSCGLLWAKSIKHFGDYARTSFPPRDIHKNPRSKCARVPQAMAQFVLKIEKLSHIMGTAPIIELALAYGLHPRLWLLFLLKIVRRVTHRITRHYSAELQRAKQTLTISKNSTEFNHSAFPCHSKVNREKLALISRLWKCENGERITITSNSFTKIVDSRSTRRIPPAVAVRMRKFRPLQEPIKLQDFFNSTRSRAQKKIKCFTCDYTVI